MYVSRYMCLNAHLLIRVCTHVCMPACIMYPYASLYGVSIQDFMKGLFGVRKGTANMV